ncbi:hypothetical protein DH2020_042825 [Rehmannia glutinosa]|uniref:Reverse transcriptase Ty1/copia-type domain-containing protein n=1 Tax=Rehmannia glutinosa TaxID=99300 RepID=A0ABR0ULC2_REHGL
MFHNPGDVYKLKKALSGLKQVPRAWFEKFSVALISLGFRRSDHDSALFVKNTTTGLIVLSFYVDDMIIMGNDVDGIALLKSELSFLFEMKDLGYLRYFLGMEVSCSPKGYLLSQSKYAGILDCARLTNTRTVNSPIEVNVDILLQMAHFLADPTLCRAIVGNLVYLTITCPYIAYVIHIVGYFVTSPTTVH